MSFLVMKISSLCDGATYFVILKSCARNITIELSFVCTAINQITFASFFTLNESLESFANYSLTQLTVKVSDVCCNTFRSQLV